MAHRKNKPYLDSDNSRQAYRWRKRNGCMTNMDKKRNETYQETSHNSKINALIQSGEVKTKIKRGGIKNFNIRKH